VAVIRTAAELLGRLRRESLRHPFRKPPVVLSIPELSAQENLVWQARLESLRLECGCRAAAIALGCFALGGVAYVIVTALQPIATAEPDYRAIAVNCAVFFAGLIVSALFGRIVGLELANVRYRQTCVALTARIERPIAF
jgi:hypothetical protein